MIDIIKIDKKTFNQEVKESVNVRDLQLSQIFKRIELIKISQERKILVNCLKELSSAKNFSEVFLIVNKIKLKLGAYGLRILMDIIRIIRFNEEEEESALLYIYLADILSLEIMMQCRIEQNVNKESNLRDKIVDNFDNIFSEYNFVKKEFSLKNKFRIDILAKCKKNNRDIIIELKKKNTNPNKQLQKYAKYFSNPKLICISEEEIKCKQNDIEYLLFKNLI